MNIVSFGGGTNSAAMIIGLYRAEIPIDLILFADTGGEQPHTYAFMELFNDWLKGRGLPRITAVEYHAKDGKRLTLEDECLKSNTLPAIAYGHKTCSQKHKIAPQDKFCNNSPLCKAVWAQRKRIRKYIGYDAGETRRIDHGRLNDILDDKYEKVYPLYKWGWTREKCAEIISRESLPHPGKSSCFFCPSMKKREIETLYLTNPDLFERAAAIELNAVPTLKTVKGLGRNWSWREYIRFWLEAREPEATQTTLDDFPDSPAGCVCGTPCGCYDG